MELFGQCCVIAGAPAWPPSADARDTLAALCRNADTLKQYLQGCRAILALVRAPAGELVSTRALVQGARKAKPGGGNAFVPVPLRNKSGTCCGGSTTRQSTGYPVRCRPAW
jgi:hypothetical protein